ncbi:dihydrofolate reductase family protein [Leifsonia sp. NPDC014704]|uniref:dihydrofolate reductase family protein n=1 Tax=Leifsonia sp. NPDC014704 TaxID=3364123 RepID=UPI0036F46B06
MNQASKAVLASMPVALDAWSGSTAVGGLESWLDRTVPQRDVVVIGSGSVVAELAGRDAIDEYRLLTFPTAVGAGRRLFDAAGSPTELRLVSAEQVGPAVLSVLDPRG